jgi:type II secretory pathway component PulF
MDWLPTRIVFAVSNAVTDWLIAVIFLAILFGAWRVIRARRRPR